MWAQRTGGKQTDKRCTAIYKFFFTSSCFLSIEEIKLTGISSPHMNWRVAEKIFRLVKPLLSPPWTWESNFLLFQYGYSGSIEIPYSPHLWFMKLCSHIWSVILKGACSQDAKQHRRARLVFRGLERLVSTDQPLLFVVAVERVWW